MRNTIFIILVAAILLSSLDTVSAGSSVLNRIEGQVYDQSRNPVADAFVELYNDVNSQIGRTKTSSSGRFFFIGMPAGRFTVKVLPLGKNLRTDSQDVEIVNQNARSDLVMIEFILKPDRTAEERMRSETPEVVFVQEVPDSAKEALKKGIKLLDEKDPKALVEIEKAVEIFPEYFEALNRLGKEYINRGEYKTGYPFLLRAVDINPRSFDSFYSLGFAFYKLNEMPAAKKAISAAVALNSESGAIQLLFGTILRISGDLPEAEKALQKSLSLSKDINPETYWQLSLLYNKLGRNSDAARQLEKYLKIMPNHPEKENILELIKKLRASREAKKS